MSQGFVLRFLPLAAALIFVPENQPAFGNECEIPSVTTSRNSNAGTELMLCANEVASAEPKEKQPPNLLLALTKSEERDISNRAFPLLSAKWPFNVVFVCWENPTDADSGKRALVRQAVVDSWQSHSMLEFLGWNECVTGSAGVRIKIEDTGPHVKELGRYLDGIPAGMVLNFTFEVWGTSCKANMNTCIKSIAVHEFGHAIGFAHEQNRPDKPGECNELPLDHSGDTILSPWDPHSVMNYCNAKYNNDGVLSEFDAKAVMYIYGSL